MDKDIALVIAEMLIKQDETTTQLKETNLLVQETNNILRDFIGISVKQFEQQQSFTEVMVAELKEIKKAVVSHGGYRDQGKSFGRT